MTQFGLTMTEDEVYMNEGRTGSGTINMLAQRFWGRDATEEEKQRIYAAKSDAFNTRPEAPRMPGAMEVLLLVKKRGMKIVLVTGSAQTSLLEKLNHNFPGCFEQDLMVTGFDVKQGKPFPEPYLMGLKKAGVNADEAIVIENAPLGVEAGHRAGIYTIAVNTGPLSDNVLKDAGADIVLPDHFALAELLNKILPKKD